MILGRPSSLWLALVAGVLNFAVIVLGIHLDTDQLVAANGLALVVIGILANEQNPTSAGTFALTTRAPGGR